MATPEQKTLEGQITETSKKIELLKKQLKAKTKEIDTRIEEDNADLFGSRKSEATEQTFLFSERVKVSERDKVLNPIKLSLKTAETELLKLTELQNKLPNTGKLF
ncbi:hypothetical protein [Flavobacterium sp. GNP002]